MIPETSCELHLNLCDQSWLRSSLSHTCLTALNTLCVHKACVCVCVTGVTPAAPTATLSLPEWPRLCCYSLTSSAPPRHLTHVPLHQTGSEKLYFWRLHLKKLSTLHSRIVVSGRSTCRWWNVSSLKSWWAFPPSHGCNFHTWLLEDFPGHNFNRFHSSVFLHCNKMWQTYVLLVLLFWSHLWLSLPWRSTHAEKVDCKMECLWALTCARWRAYEWSEIISWIRMFSSQLKKQMFAEAWNPISLYFISDLIKSRAAPLISSECLLELFTLDFHAALTQKMRTHSLNDTHGISGSLTKSSFIYCRQSSFQKVSFDCRRHFDLSSFQRRESYIQRWRNGGCGVDIHVNLEVSIVSWNIKYRTESYVHKMWVMVADRSLKA